MVDILQYHSKPGKSFLLIQFYCDWYFMLFLLSWIVWMEIYLAVRSTVLSLVAKQIQKSRAWHECVYNTTTEANDDPQLNSTVRNKVNLHSLQLQFFQPRFLFQDKIWANLNYHRLAKIINSLIHRLSCCVTYIWQRQELFGNNFISKFGNCLEIILFQVNLWPNSEVLYFCVLQSLNQMDRYVEDWNCIHHCFYSHSLVTPYCWSAVSSEKECFFPHHLP